MDSIKWKCKNLIVYFENFDNFHLFHLIVEKLDQVYSNTRVPTQVNTNQHESTQVRHESTRVRHESTRINTSLTRVLNESTRINTSQKVS